MATMLDDVLISLRRILRATSIHSRKLGRSVGITSPQLIVLQAVHDQETPTASEVSRAVSLSQATITTIVNTLEKRDLVRRERSTVDRRRVHISLTKSGEEALRDAPKPLQESFARRFEALPSWEQHQLVASLERVAMMMDAEDLDASPVLDEAPDIH